MNVVDLLFDLFERQGGGAYFGESVSEKEHALQAAHLAEREGAADTLVVAALLHDVGHLLHELPETIAAQGIDGRHETAGEAWLARYFGPAVTDPVRWHVAAKRYLCAVEPTYLDELSPASRQSLALQGGPFTASEIAEFEKLAFWQDAVRLRRWDDRAKVAGWDVPGLGHYRAHVESCLLPASREIA
jgi:gamma-butyrobetaine dioxygenase